MGDRVLRRLQQQLKKTEASLLSAYERFTSLETSLISQRGRWLVDNFYLVEATIKQLHKDLTPALFRKLSVLKEGRRKGFPRIYRLAERYLAINKGRFNRESFIDFVNGYQQLRELTSVEIWTLPVVLRLILLSDLAYFLKNQGHLEGIKNRVTSLRTLSLIRWEKIFEVISLVEKILAQDPAGIYTKMDEKSKDAYRHTIEQLAQGSRYSEIQIARLVISKCQESENPKTHIGVFLHNGELKKLKHEIKYRPKALNRWVEAIKDHPYLVYFGLILGIMEVVGIDLYASIGAWAIFLVILLSDGVIALINFFISSLVPPTPPLQVDLSTGITEKSTTFVAVSCLLEDKDTILELVSNLEKRYLANKENNLFFALLADFKDSSEAVLPQDQILLDTARQKIRELNKKYHTKQNNFYLLVRKRVYINSEKVWMGWERKRGKLIEFVNLLKGEETNYVWIIGNKRIFPQVRFVISLDADTTLPLGTAKKLIGAMEHPLNKPIIDPHKNIVIEGYGLIQPRVDTSIWASAKSRFSQTFSQGAGLDPYSSAISNIYQDLFGAGIYLGKAIFDVEIFYKVICNSFPTNALLSHDLLEGSFLRTGFASNIQLLEDFPGGYDAYQRRQNRWVRGDWQFTPWLFETSLPFINKWQIFDNLRRSLVPPVTFLLFVMTFFIPKLTHIWPDIIAFFLIPYLIELMGVMTQSQVTDSRTGFWFAVKTHIFRIFMRLLLDMSLLANSSVNLVRAIVVTIIRKLVSHTNLLQWEAAAKTEKIQAKGVKDYYYAMRGGIIVTLAIAFAVYSFHTTTFPLAAPLLCLWLASPIFANFMSKRNTFLVPRLSMTEEEELLSYAKQIWSFFNKLTDITGNFIPPDNYQIAPGPKIIYKTSPTNIGLYLLVLVIASELRLIDGKTFNSKLKQTLQTISKLKTYRGHLYNWYDLTTLKPIRPLLISSVDSGNFIACLLVLKQFLLANNNSKFASQIEAIISKTNFTVLFNSEQQLFSVGFNLDTKHLEDSYYDLFGSEARLTGFVAIAMNQIPAKHWFTMSRPLALVDKFVTIKSWGGSVFEQFFPSLFMKTVPNSLLDYSQKGVIKQQIKTAIQEKRPWGMSESAFFDLAPDKTYKYRIFGNWQLGIKPDLYLYRIISPYSSFLALPYFPKEAIQNLRKLSNLGALAEYGFFESLDFTSSHLSEEQEYGMITEYLSHHQAMSLLAIGNYLMDDVIIKHFHANPEIVAIETLLEEKPPDYPVVTN